MPVSSSAACLSLRLKRLELFLKRGVLRHGYLRRRSPVQFMGQLPQLCGSQGKQNVCCLALLADLD